MDLPTSFGYWVRRRRKALDLTQADLARRVGCAEVTIQKIEADERRPSSQIADLLAAQLRIPPAERATFLQRARGERAADPLPASTSDDRQIVNPPATAATAAPAQQPPSGTVTFLFTDIEGSTQLWEQHPQAMADALARHDAIMRQAIAAAAGVVYKVIGDAFQAAFTTAPAACAAALAAQRALANEAWGVIGAVPVRMALHTCAAVPEDGDYRTGALNRLGRLLGAVHGGQIVLSRSAADLARETLPPDVTLRDLGERHLRDLRPEPVFQLGAPDLPSEFPPLKTLDRPLHNLPAQPTALIGREQAIATVCAMLRRPDVRLLTLTGPGGTGKTRLALAAATELIDTLGDGGCFVDLAPIRDPALVASTIAQALGIRETAGISLIEHLQAYLGDKQLVLVLDNFEQVLDAAPLLAKLLAACPAVKILVTSRATLHLSGEHEYRVPPLALPPTTDHRALAQRAPPAQGRRPTLGPKGAPGSGPATGDARDVVVGGQWSVVGQYAAVQLFVARAQAALPNFALTDANAAAVAAICRRLDGLPLAIELAAVRIKLLPPPALLERLEQRLPLLTGGARDLPARQQTLRAAIGWSYELLDAGEQRLFRSLGVFVGGWTLEAAEAVCQAEDDLPIDIMDGVAALVDKSLLQQTVGLDDEPRFMMLETICEYALEQLEARGEAEALRARHATWVRELVEHAAPLLRGPEQVFWLKRLEAAHANLRAALSWRLTNSDPAEGLRIAGAIWMFWSLHGHAREGLHWLERCLAITPRVSGIGRARALLGSAWLRSQLDFLLPAGVVSELQEATRLFQASGALAEAAVAQVFQTGVVVAAGDRDTDADADLVAACEANARAGGDPWALCVVLQDLAVHWASSRDFQRAQKAIAEALPLARKVGEPSLTAYTLWRAARLSGAQIPERVRMVAEAEQIVRELGDLVLVARLVAYQGDLARASGDDVRAATFYRRAQQILHEHGSLQGEAMMAFYLGQIALTQRDLKSAAMHYGQALARARESERAFGMGLGLSLLGIGQLAMASSQPNAAARLFGTVAARFGEGFLTSERPEDDEIYQQAVATAQFMLGGAAYAAAFAAGKTLTMEQAIAEALNATSPAPPP